MSKPLFRLVYTSFRKTKCCEKEIKNILDACKRNNPKKNITGVLVHSNNRFLQYLEGSESDVEELYQQIKEDGRHTSVNKRNFEPIAERVFPSWEMGYKDFENGLSFHTDVKEEDKETILKMVNDEVSIDNRGMKVLQLFFQS